MSVQIVAVLVLVLGVVGCTGSLSAVQDESKANSGGISADAALQITGLVESEIGWSEEEIRSMEPIEAESTNKEGKTKTYTGVRISELLSKAGPTTEATKLVLVADDGSTTDVSLAEIEACTDCIVSFRSQGGFSIVAPGFPGNAQVKGVVELQVK
jgi:hypothetical protein